MTDWMLCCHSEGSWQSEERGKWEPHEIQEHKCKALCLGKNNPRYKYTLETDWKTIFSSKHYFLKKN